MSGRPVEDKGWAVAAVLAALLAAGIFSYLLTLRPSQARIWGDEGTYIGMAASLARDGDLAFTEADLDWALERGAIAQAARRAERSEDREAPLKGVTVILQRTEAGITYSKPLLYPLLAALPYKLAGEPGMLAVNALALFLGLYLAALFLGRLGTTGHRWLTLATFASAIALAPYLAWRMSESLQFGLALAGLVLALGGLRKRATGARANLLDHRLAPWLGGAMLGLLAAMRTSNSLLLVGALVACLLAAGLRRSLMVAGGALLGLALILSASQIGLGTISPYTAERASFNDRIGYPAGPGAEEAMLRFEERPATHRPSFELSRAQAYSALYLFVGRHTGLLAYFPLALVMIWLLLRRPSRVGVTLLATALGLAAFYLFYTPFNYFGGSTFVGNRYFLVAYPALLVGLAALPPARILLATLAVTLLFGVSATRSVRLAEGLDETSQSHTALGAFRYLPYETTAREIQGQKYRFWSGDYLRFTDHWAAVERRRFVLHSDRPYSELMLARSLVPPRTYFLVRPPRLAERLAWRPANGLTWRRPTPDPERPGVVSIETGRTWRQHPLGWQSRAIYDLRMLQLRLEDDGERQQAEIYYLGGSHDILASFPPEVVAIDLPSVGIPGEVGSVRLEIRNRGERNWDADDVLPITVVVRLLRNGEEIVRRQRPIDREIGPNASVEIEQEITWPDEPGEYTLGVDLTLHPLRSEIVGEGLLILSHDGEVGPGG